MKTSAARQRDPMRRGDRPDTDPPGVRGGRGLAGRLSRGDYSHWLMALSSSGRRAPDAVVVRPGTGTVAIPSRDTVQADRPQGSSIIVRKLAGKPFIRSSGRSGPWSD